MEIVIQLFGLIVFAALSSGVVFAAPKDVSAESNIAIASDVDNLLVAHRYRDALAPLQQKLDLARRERDARAEAAALHHLGVAYLGLHEIDQAAALLNEAAALAGEIGSATLQASAFDNLGTLLRKRDGGAEAARKAYRQAIRIAEAEGSADLAFNALTNLARLEIDEQRSEPATALLRRAYDNLASAREEGRRTEDLLLIGRLFSRAGAIEAGFGALSEARDRARDDVEPRSESLAAGYLGDLYADLDRSADATALYAQASFLAQAAEAPELIYRWTRQSARITAGSGEVDAAIEHYRRAVRALERVRPTLQASPTSAIAPAEIRSVYVELADLLLRRAAGSASAEVKQRDLEEARETIERYRTSELTDYFQDECVADLLSRVKPVDRLAPRTAVLYPIVMADRLAILLSLPDGLQQRSLPIGAKDLTENVLAFRELLQKRTTNQFLRPARRLYDLLLRPLEPAFSAAAIDTLVIVPDEALRMVPLGAMHDGERFVIDRYALATVPSLRLIEPKALTASTLQPLVAGLSESVQGFSPLPHVESELSMVGALLGGDTLSNDEFVTGQMEQSLGSIPYSVVHIASHAQFTGDTRESFILTYDGRLDMDRLEDFIKLSRFRDEPVELLTLSACQTAEGDDRAALGLAGLAVKAGARSALASLWHVNDLASSLLITDFYQRLGSGQGISKAKALQQAQIETKADLRYRHPAFWAPFVMIGNWL